MESTREWLAPCGLYCGVCAVRIAHRINNDKFKKKLADQMNLRVEDIRCSGCHSDEPFLFAHSCPIRTCADLRGYSGCHQCSSFPCAHLNNFMMPVERKVMLRAVPRRKEIGDEAFILEEEKRYRCPHCGYAMYRGATLCHGCRAAIDLDG